MNWSFAELFQRILPGGLTALAMAVLLKLGGLQSLELMTYTLLFNLRGEIPWDERVVVIAIDDASLRELGRFPWPRKLYAQLLKQLTPAEPAVIAFDVILSEPSADDAEFAAAIQQQGTVVLASTWDTKGFPLVPVASLREAALTYGHVLTRQDGDGLVRILNPQVKSEPAFVISILEAYTLRESYVPLPSLDRPFWINWPGRTQKLPHYSFADVLQGKVPNQAFHKKIVLVGATATAMDSQATPFDRSPPGNGVHVHAAGLSTLLRQNSLRVTPELWLYGILLIGGLSFSLILPRRQLQLQLAVWFAGCLVWLFLGWLLLQQNIWLPISAPILLFSLTGGAVSLYEQHRTRSLLQSSQSQLLQQTFYDSLTGLPNRIQFVQLLQQAILDLQAKPDYAFAVVVLDLDRFQSVNDSLGHEVGDQLLQKLVTRLSTCFSPETSIARLGEDEFAVLLENPGDHLEMSQAIERVQQQLALPFYFAPQEVFVTVSVGVVIGMQGYNNPEQLLGAANLAMHQAREQGNSQFRIYSPELHTQAITRLQLENDLRRVLDREELQVHYQPVISLYDSTLEGFEALLRWQHPVRGKIPPDIFIPLAEETGLIIPIGLWALQESCRQLKEWQDCFMKHPPLYVSVNLSGKQFSEQNLPEQILEILYSTGLPASSLKLEITESVLIKDKKAGAAMLSRLRQAGIQISMDDFGTGYSSLSYLQQFDFDVLKIDRSFIANIGKSNESLEIVQSLINLAHKLGIGIVAEGVETKEQLEYLKTMGCDNTQVQGYFFAQPLTVDAAEQFIAFQIQKLDATSSHSDLTK